MSQLVLIEYLGRRQPYKDAVCGSGATFLKTGDVQAVTKDAASKMLSHPSVYRLAAQTPVAVDQEADFLQKKNQAEKNQAQRESEDIRHSLLTMDKDALSSFASIHFNQKIDKRQSVDSLREQVAGWMDQFGLNP